MWLWQIVRCFLKGQQISVFSKLSRPALRLTQPPLQWVGSGGTLPVGKAAGT